MVANLSRYAQWTELDLAAYAGLVPVELFGAVEFPRIGSEPYRVKLGPHSFLWFRLARDPLAGEGPAWHEDDLPELRWRGDLAAARCADRVTRSPTCCCAGWRTQQLVPR